MESTLFTYLQIGVDLLTVEVWAMLQATCLSRGSRKSENDLWIAATAIQYAYPVASLDDDFFEMPGHHLDRRKGARTCPSLALIMPAMHRIHHPILHLLPSGIHR